MVEWKTLGDICEIKGRIGFRGYTREDQVDKGNGAISLSPGNIFDSVLNYDSCTYITWEKYEESPEIMVNEGDIILCKTASVGKVARVRQLPEKATINPQLVLIKNIKTNPQYLFYILDDTPFQVKIKGLAGVGSVPNVSQAKLSSIQIPIPSLEEQNRIVGILDTFTAGIENIKEQIAQRRKQYEFYRDQLLDLEGKPGVEWFELLELCDYVDYRGKTPSKVDAGIFLVTAKNIRKGYIDYDNSKEYISEDDYEEVMHRGKPQIGDVLVTTEAPLGNVAQIDNENIALAQRVIKYRPKDERLNSSYLKYILLGSEFQIRLEKEATGATAKGIKGSKLHRMHIPLPPLSEQQRIVSILDTFEASIQNLETQLKQREKQYEYYRNKLLTFE